MQLVMVGAFSTKNYSLDRLHALGIINTSQFEDSETLHFTPHSLEINFKWARLKMEQTSENTRMSFVLFNKDKVMEFKDLSRSLIGLSSGINLTATGLNFIFVITMNNEKSWHDLGDKLVPKDHWYSQLEAKKSSHIGMSIVALKCKDYLDKIIENAPTPELNIEIRPTDTDKDGNKLKFGCLITINFNQPHNDILSFQTNLELIDSKFEEYKSLAYRTKERILEL